jgi:hypothetical protein
MMANPTMRPQSELAPTMAKLAGVRRALVSILNENISRPRADIGERFRAHFTSGQVGHYFAQAAGHLGVLKALLPKFYGDFQEIAAEPDTPMTAVAGEGAAPAFSRALVERLVRDIDQIFEIRANSELGQPVAEAAGRVHEVGFFQGRYGRDRVILLHEDGVSIPTNLGGVVYVPFPKGQIEAAFQVLGRELVAICGA